MLTIHPHPPSVTCTTPILFGPLRACTFLIVLLDDNNSPLALNPLLSTPSFLLLNRANILFLLLNICHLNLYIDILLVQTLFLLFFILFLPIIVVLNPVIELHHLIRQLTRRLKVAKSLATGKAGGLVPLRLEGFITRLRVFEMASQFNRDVRMACRGGHGAGSRIRLG